MYKYTYKHITGEKYMTTPILTIGMATYDDFNGVYFSIQSLRMFHSMCMTSAVEFIVIDNNPDSNQGQAVKKFIEGHVSNARYIPYTKKKSTSVRNQIFTHAQGDITLSIDCHVMIEPGGLETLVEYFKDTTTHKNIVTGPLWTDNLQGVSTHFKPGWRGNMYGTWDTDPQYHLDKPFEIPMNGCGLFACKTNHWPEFSHYFVGFGGEEWYIQEKFRKNGGKAICIPSLKWVHRFQRPDGVLYPNTYEDRVFNYYVGWLELYRDPTHEMILSITQHFSNVLTVQKLENIKEQAMKKLNIQRPKVIE